LHIVYINATWLHLSISAKEVFRRERGRGGREVWGGIPPHPSAEHQHASACSFKAERRKQNFLFLLEEKGRAQKRKL
jgi:hypothetical protein